MSDFDFNDVLSYLRFDYGYDFKQLALFSYLYDEGEFQSVEDYINENAEVVVDAADYVSEVVGDIENSYGNEYTSQYGDYLIFDNEEEAFDEAVEYEKQVLDDIGIDGIRFDRLDYPMSHYVDQDWFESYFQESYEFYAQDIESESSSRGSWTANRLIEECIDAGIITEDELDDDGEYIGGLDLVNELADFLTDGIGDYVEEYKFQMGEDEFNAVVKEYKLIDFDELAFDFVQHDGVAIELASYDGEEVEYEYDGKTYYMYRTN